MLFFLENSSFVRYSLMYVFWHHLANLVCCVVVIESSHKISSRISHAIKHILTIFRPISVGFYFFLKNQSILFFENYSFSRFVLISRVKIYFVHNKLLIIFNVLKKIKQLFLAYLIDSFIAIINFLNDSSLNSCCSCVSALSPIISPKKR